MRESKGDLTEKKKKKDKEEEMKKQEKSKGIIDLMSKLG